MPAPIGLPGLVPRPPRLTAVVATGPPVATWPPVVATMVAPLLPTGSPVGVPVATVIPAIRIAVEVVVAAAPLPVVAPSRIPKVARAPVIQRYRAGLGLRGTRRQTQAGHPQPCGYRDRRSKLQESFCHAKKVPAAAPK
jgi:hypothetical protein